MPCSATVARDLLTRIYDKAFIRQALVLHTKNYTLNNISIFSGNIFCKSMKFFDFEKRLKKIGGKQYYNKCRGGGGTLTFMYFVYCKIVNLLQRASRPSVLMCDLYTETL